jgi:serine/threonine protein kinase/cytochrome c551/c552
MAPNLATCSECGTGVPPDARTLGLCPRCLMRSALVGSDGGRLAPRVTDAPNASSLGDALPGLDVLDLIGRGGMGLVYRARQRSLDRVVAVKLFPRDAYADDPTFAERFANEARILASLSHPNIVAAYEFGETDRYCHLVMELVQGESLRQRMERSPVPFAQAIDLARQVCDALAYAHSRGVVHRDIKPENVLLEHAADGRPRARVADFGLAKLVRRRPTDFSLTSPNRMMGTPDYMAPEQRSRPADVDARADVYALGVVLYEMLAGQLPLGRFAPPSVDPDVNRLVLRCLETRPEDRFATIPDLRLALDAVGHRPPPDRRRALGAAALAALAIAGVAGWSFWPRSEAPPDQASRPPRHIAAAASQPTPTDPAPAPTARGQEFRAGPGALVQPGIPPDQWRPRRPQFGPPYGPPDFPTGPAAMLERMIADHTADRVVRVLVDNLPGDVRTFVVDRLRDLAGASSSSSSGGGTSLTVLLAPVRDVEAFSKKIDFGKVVKVDPITRTIEVVIDDPGKLPAPLPPAVKTPADPNFYPQNLADLSAWDKRRRQEALDRLARAEPAQLKPEITAALTRLAGDPDAAVRKSALAALATWLGADAVPTLATALKDDDLWVRRAALDALGSIKTPRAAQAIASAMAADRHHAAAALKRIGPPAEDAALALLTHDDAWVQLEAAKTLGEIGSAKSLPALAKAQTSTDGLVRMAADQAAQAIRTRAAQ